MKDSLVQDYAREARRGYSDSGEPWRTPYAEPWKDQAHLAEVISSIPRVVTAKPSPTGILDGKLIRCIAALADLGLPLKTALMLVPLAVLFVTAAWGASSDQEQAALLGKLVQIAGAALLAYVGFLGAMLFSHHSKISKLEARADESLRLFKEQLNRSNKKRDDISSKLETLLKRH